MAFRDGELGDRARVGAILLADGIECLRELRAFVRAVGRAGRKGG
jgi:hypothetical protein